MSKLDQEQKARGVIEKVRPYIQMHGGDVAVEKIENGTVTLLVSGACARCSMVELTYNKLIGGLLKEKVPELNLQIIYKK